MAFPMHSGVGEERMMIYGTGESSFFACILVWIVAEEGPDFVVTWRCVTDVT